MPEITYNQIYISPSEDDYLDSFDIDYSDAPIYPWHGPIVNHIIDYIATEMIDKLDISDESKDTLRGSIATNSICTIIDTEPENFPEHEREQIQDFISSF